MLNESETGSRGVDSGLGSAKELFPCIRNFISPYRFLTVYQCHTALGNSFGGLIIQVGCAGLVVVKLLDIACYLSQNKLL